MTDGSGRPVTGLTAADFTVLEDGRPQAIEVFHAIDLEPRPWPATWMASIRQDVDSNEPAAGRLLAIVVDDAMMSKPGPLNAARRAVRGLIDRLTPDDRATLVFTRDSRGAQPSTSDPTRLADAIGTLTPGFARMGRDPWMDVHHASGALRTLEEVVRVIGASRHFPRAIVYVGPGVNIDWTLVSSPAQLGNLGSFGTARQQAHQRYAAGLRAILRRAAALNIVIHTVDPDSATPGEFQLSLARATGGVAIGSALTMTGGTAHVDRQVARIDEATRTLYLIGYAPASLAPGLRRVDVRVRRPGLMVRTRSHYERVERDSAEFDTKRSDTDAAAIRAVLPEAGIPLQIAATALPEGTSRRAAVAVVLRGRRPGDGTMEPAMVVVNAYDMEGKLHASVRGTTEGQVEAATGDSREFEWRSRLQQLSPGRYQLRAGVQFATTGQTASVFTDVHVPDFTKDGLHVAGIFLARGASRLPAHSADLPVLPTAQREFGRGATPIAFARLVQGGRGRLQTVTISVRLIDQEGALLRETFHELQTAAFDRSRTADFRFELPTDDLAPGWYLLRLEAALPNGRPQVQETAVLVRPRLK